MDQQTISTSISPEVIIEETHGHLQVKGWEHPEVAVKASPDEVSVVEENDLVRIRCRGHLTVRLPYGATVRVERVHGDARFKLLEDQLTIEEVDGSLTLRNISEVSVESVHGELFAKHIQGNINAGRIDGNAILRDVQGSCTLETVNGNLDLRDIEGEVNTACSGNCRLRLSEMTGERYILEADGNLQAYIPEDADLRLKLSSDGERINVKLPDRNQSLRQPTCELTLGSGQIEMELSAGGNLMLTGTSGDVDDSDADGGADFGAGFSEEINRQVTSQIDAQMQAMNRQLQEQLAHLQANIGRAGLSAEESERIMRQARDNSERATARVQEQMRRTQEKLERKLEAARRKNELKAQAADRRSQSRGRRGWSFEWPPAPPSPPTPPAGDPVSEEERLMILRMLEEKKISLEEAEALLSALEGKG